MTAAPATPKDYAAATARVGLDAFLRSGRRLDFTPAGPPRVTALMLVRGRAEVTFACLRSLAVGLNRTPLELVVVDNGSRDATAALLARLDGVTVLRNPANVGFPAGVNQAAAHARGEYLLLINNDTEVLGRSVDAAVDCLDAQPDVGLVGGRVVLMDGTLQEAGCLIRSDGWTHQYARGLPPDHPAAGFERDTDYCSFAFALVRRAAFAAVGGLDEGFSPGYFEDPDFAVRLRTAGWRIVYRPDVVVLHHENATAAGTIESIPALVTRNQRTFAARHAGWLADQLPLHPTTVELGRRADDAAVPVLLLTGPAAPGVGRLVRALEALDAAVTVGHTTGGPQPADLPPTVETLPLPTASDLDGLLAGRPLFFQLALVVGRLPAWVEPVLRRHRLAWAEPDGDRFRLAGP